MTQEEKELLLKDLLGRVLYKLHCRVFKLNEDIKENDDILYGVIGDNVITLKSDKDECLMYYQVKPYLRPMSSMTEEEGKELEHLLCEIDAPCWVDTTYGCVTFASDNDFIDAEIAEVYTDWLNKKGFDYRGLIPMGLALEAPKDMYKTE